MVSEALTRFLRENAGASAGSLGILANTQACKKQSMSASYHSLGLHVEVERFDAAAASGYIGSSQTSGKRIRCLGHLICKPSRDLDCCPVPASLIVPHAPVLGSCMKLQWAAVAGTAQKVCTACEEYKEHCLYTTVLVAGLAA